MNKKPKILFRADGNSEIGLGHLYRLFALYEMFKDNYYCILITRDNSSIEVIPKHYNLQLIPNSIIVENEPNWFKENYSIDTIIVLDGYDFKEDYQQKIKDFGYKLVYIDDLIEGTQKADLVINHSPGVKESDYETESYTKLALGADFAILRPLFLEAAKQNRKITKIDTAFICFGGSDIYDLTLKATNAILEIEQFEKINIVIGAAYQRKKIFELQKTTPQINLFQNLSEKDLIKVMKNSNFAIAPASTILFELLAVKMPILSGYIAENQMLFYLYLRKNNIIFGIDNFNEVNSKDLENAILEMLKVDSKIMNIIDGMQKQKFMKQFKLI